MKRFDTVFSTEYDRLLRTDDETSQLAPSGEFYVRNDVAKIELEQVTMPFNVKYDTASFLTGGALNDLRENAQRLSNVKNGLMDKYFHCVGFCEASARGSWSRAWAKKFGEIREVRQFRIASEKARHKFFSSVGPDLSKLLSPENKFEEKALETFAKDMELIRQDMIDDLAANQAGLDHGENYSPSGGQTLTPEEYCAQMCIDFLPEKTSTPPAPNNL